MSLRPEELDVIKYQLGVPLPRVGAEPYIAYIALFDRVIKPYLFDNTTTSSTTVPGAGAATTITIAANPTAPNDATSLVFAVGTSIVVDVGTALEVTTISALSALSLTAVFQNAHGGAAPFTIWPNGAEWIVRNILTRISTIEGNMGSIAPTTAGAKKVDEIEMYGASRRGERRGSLDAFQSLVMQREQARDDLAGAIGFPNTWRDIRSGSSSGSRGGMTRIELG